MTRSEPGGRAQVSGGRGDLLGWAWVWVLWMTLSGAASGEGEGCLIRVLPRGGGQVGLRVPKSAEGWQWVTGSCAMPERARRVTNNKRVDGMKEMARWKPDACESLVA